MTASVRENLVSTWVARIAALSSLVGAVLEEGQDFQEFAKVLSTGKAVVEVIVGNDQADQPESSVDQFKLSCALILHLPEPLPGGVSPRAMGHQLAESVYGTYGTATQEDMGGYAVTARCEMFCGGPYLTEQGTRAVLHAVEFVYRFRRGDPQGVV